MSELLEALRIAFSLILSGDPELVGIVGLSLKVSLTAVGLAGLIGLPLGAALALFRFPGRQLLNIAIDAFMGLPPVVAGLVVYLMLSRSGPFGVLGLLFTPAAMIIAQTMLVLPIVIALSRQIVGGLWHEYEEQLRSLGVSPRNAIPTLLWDGRHALATVILAGFGRASAEVGAVMIVGGNIRHSTRTMTTAIALETGKGNLELALGLGVVLLSISLLVNGAVSALKGAAEP
jgi:tungstate transport system permease protein